MFDLSRRFGRINWSAYTEPARQRAVWAAVLLFGGTLGLGQALGGWDARVQAGITFLATVVPLLQGEATRAAVYSPATHDFEVALADPESHLDAEDALVDGPLDIETVDLDDENDELGDLDDDYQGDADTDGDGEHQPVA
jgi:hypothetical protein